MIYKFMLILVMMTFATLDTFEMTKEGKVNGQSMFSVMIWIIGILLTALLGAEIVSVILLLWIGGARYKDTIVAMITQFRKK